jgi:hypothetical protein
MNICLAKEPSKVIEPTEGVNKLLSDHKIIDIREFSSKIHMKAFE